MDDKTKKQLTYGIIGFVVILVFIIIIKNSMNSSESFVSKALSQANLLKPNYASFNDRPSYKEYDKQHRLFNKEQRMLGKTYQNFNDKNMATDHFNKKYDYKTPNGNLDKYYNRENFSSVNQSRFPNVPISVPKSNFQSMNNRNMNIKENLTNVYDSSNKESDIINRPTESVQSQQYLEQLIKEQVSSEMKKGHLTYALEQKRPNNSLIGASKFDHSTNTNYVGIYKPQRVKVEGDQYSTFEKLEDYRLKPMISLNYESF